MKSSVAGKTMVIYGGILLLIISLTFLFSYLGTVKGLQRQLDKTNMALLKQIDQKIEMAFRQTENNLLQLSNELEFVYFMNDSYEDNAQKNANFYAMNALLSGFLNNNLQFSSIFVYSEVSGNILTDKTFTTKEESENQWIAEYIDMEGYFRWLPTHRIWDGYVNRDVVTLIRPYPALSAPGYRKGIVAANIDADVLYRMIRDIYEDEFQGHTFIMDNDARIIARDSADTLYPDMADMSWMREAAEGGDSGSFSADIGDVRQTVSYKTSAYTGWKIVNIVPESQMYRPLTVTRNLLAAFAAVMFVIALTAVFIVNRRTFSPIDRIIGKLARANPSPQAPTAAPQGVSYLETMFDQMFLHRESLEKQVRDSKPMLKWRTVMDILAGYRADYALIAPHLEFANIRLFPERYVVCTAEIGKEGGLTPRDGTLYTYALCNVAEEIINAENAGAAIDLGGGRAVILFSFSEGDEEQNHLRAAALLEQILDVMYRQIGLTVTAGLGKGCRAMSEVPVSYAQSQQALQYKMVAGSHAVISILDVQAPDNQDYYRIVLIIDRIADSLKLGEPDKAGALLKELFAEAIKSNLSPELIRQFSFEAVMRCAWTTEAVGVDTADVLDEIGDLHGRINGCDSWQEMERVVAAVLQGLAERVELRRSQRGRSDSFDKIRQYIQDHYRDSGLSLDRLADEFKLSPTYISRLFKEHMEDNFIDYLINIRIEAAKELLKDRTVKINDVSEAVGYTYSRSFTRTFKKYTGLTPTEYRDSIAAQ